MFHFCSPLNLEFLQVSIHNEAVLSQSRRRPAAVRRDFGAELSERPKLDRFGQVWRRRVDSIGLSRQ